MISLRLQTLPRPTFGLRFQGKKTQPVANDTPPVDTFWATQPKAGKECPRIVYSTIQTSPNFIRHCSKLLKQVPRFLLDFLHQTDNKIVLTPMLEDVAPFFSREREFTRRQQEELQDLAEGLFTAGAYQENEMQICFPQFCRVWRRHGEKLYYEIVEQIKYPVEDQLQALIHEIAHAILSDFRQQSDQYDIKSAFWNALKDAFDADISYQQERGLARMYGQRDMDEAFCEVVSACTLNKKVPGEKEDFSLMTIQQARKVFPNMYRFVITEALPRILPKPLLQETSDATLITPVQASK